MNIPTDQGYAACSAIALEVCATILNDRIETARNMLKLYRRYPGTISLAVAGRYARDYFRAIERREQLHNELERRIAKLVNL